MAVKVSARDGPPGNCGPRRADPGGRMPYAANGGLLPEHPIRVLLLRANDLRFGAVHHLFALLLGRHKKSPQEYCHPLRINRRCGNQSALGNFRARVA